MFCMSYPQHIRRFFIAIQLLGRPGQENLCGFQSIPIIYSTTGDPQFSFSHANFKLEKSKTLAQKSEGAEASRQATCQQGLRERERVRVRKVQVRPTESEWERNCNNRAHLLDWRSLCVREWVRKRARVFIKPSPQETHSRQSKNVHFEANVKNIKTTFSVWIFVSNVRGNFIWW